MKVSEIRTMTKGTDDKDLHLKAILELLRLSLNFFSMYQSIYFIIYLIL